MIRIQRRDPETDALNEVGRIEDGSIVDGDDALRDLFSGDVPGEDELLERFRGPTLFAGRVDMSAASAAATDALKGTPIHEGAERLTKDDLANWVAWVRAGRPPVERTDDPDDDVTVEARTFNPELHPRGPDGKFVERPWDVPDGLDIDSIRETPTLSLLRELNDAGEPIDDVLSDTNIQIDGIPDDVNSVAEAEERVSGSGLVFQDLESGDTISIDAPNEGGTVSGTIEKTEQVDGAPNVAHVRDVSGAVYEVPVPDGTTMARNGGPTVPPTGINESDSMLPEDISEGQKVSVVSGIMDGMEKEHVATGGVTSLTADPGEDFPGDGIGIEVNGDKYDAAHDNIQVYDASPDELSFDDVSEGDGVAAFSAVSGTKYADGEVIDKAESPDGQYVTIDDAATGDEVQVHVGSSTLTPPETYDAGDADAVEGDGAPDVDDVTPENIDGLSPSQVGTGDIMVSDTSSVEPHQLNPGDWIVFEPKMEGEDPGVGRISDISGTGNQALVDVGDETREIPLFSQNTLERVDTPSAKASEVEPGSLEGADFHTPDLNSDPEFGPGDWAYVADGDAGEARVGIIDDASGDMISVETDVGVTQSFDMGSDTVVTRGIPPGQVLDAADDAAPEGGDAPDVSNVDPASVSSAALNSSDVTMAADVDEFNEGDWVYYEDDDGVHAGQIESKDGEQVEVKTGHYTDPQQTSDLSLTAKIDPESIAVVGDDPGVESTTTQTPADHEDFDLPDVDDFTDKPNPPESLSKSDMKHPVSPPDEPGFGMLSEQHEDALIEAGQDPAFGGTDVFQTSKTDHTGHRPGEYEMEYPQADGGAVKETVKQFVDEVHGIPSTSTGIETDSLFDDIHDWKGTSYSDQSQAVEKAFHAGLRLPGDVRNHGLDGEDPSPTKAAIAASLSRISQEFIRSNRGDIQTVEQFGVEAEDDEIPLYRGVASAAVGSLLRDWAEDPSADEITAKSSKIGNYTTDASMADSWSTKDVVFKQNAKVEDVVMAPDLVTSGETGIDDEAEVWLTGGVENADPSNIQIRSRSSTPGAQGPRTMADLPEDPQELVQEDLNTLHEFANRMVSKAGNPSNDKTKYLLGSDSQVATMYEVIDKMETEAMAQYKIDKMYDFVEQSENMLAEMDEPGAGEVAA